MFGGLYFPFLCGWYYRCLWAQQRAALLCRRDRPSLVRSVGKLLCSSLVLTLSADWHMNNPLLCYLPLPYCRGGCCPFFFYAIGCAILFCATPSCTTVGADAAYFFYGRRVWRPFIVLPPYTTHRFNAACFGAMSVSVLGD